MTAHSDIEWTDATWNPVRGCTRVSEGCRNCYAEVMAARFSGPGQWGEGFAAMKSGGEGAPSDHRWTGKVELIESQLDLPTRWRKPRRIFVNSTSDLFHESLSTESIMRVFNVMAGTPHHTYQILTKRPVKMSVFLMVTGIVLPNVWLGTSIEDQESANQRIPHLLGIPAACKFVSAEPLLGPINLTEIRHKILVRTRKTNAFNRSLGEDGLGWVICGGESGPGARPMHPDWARSLRDQCSTAGVPFFFKQWGGWFPWVDRQAKDLDWRKNYSRFQEPEYQILNLAGGRGFHGERVHVMKRAGKGANGRQLDGREHDDFPKVAA